MGYDTKAEYDTKLQNFVSLLNQNTPSTWEMETGRKFDKVFVVDSNGDKYGRYMVEHKTGNIYAIKSWAQVNTRRWFGTLDTVDQFDWTPHQAVAKPNSEAAGWILDREKGIAAGYKKRGRPKKNPA